MRRAVDGGAEIFRLGINAVDKFRNVNIPRPVGIFVIVTDKIQVARRRDRGIKFVPVGVDRRSERFRGRPAVAVLLRVPDIGVFASAVFARMRPMAVIIHPGAVGGKRKTAVGVIQRTVGNGCDNRSLPGVVDPAGVPHRLYRHGVMAPEHFVSVGRKSNTAVRRKRGAQFFPDEFKRDFPRHLFSQVVALEPRPVAIRIRGPVCFERFRRIVITPQPRVKQRGAAQAVRGVDPGAPLQKHPYLLDETSGGRIMQHGQALCVRFFEIRSFVG